MCYVIRRWIQIAGEWHLPCAPGDHETACCTQTCGGESSCETSGVPGGAVCPDCYRSTKTQGEIDALAEELYGVCYSHPPALEREIRLLIGATR